MAKELSKDTRSKVIRTIMDMDGPELELQELIIQRVTNTLDKKSRLTAEDENLVQCAIMEAFAEFRSMKR